MHYFNITPKEIDNNSHEIIIQFQKNNIINKITTDITMTVYTSIKNNKFNII